MLADLAVNDKEAFDVLFETAKPKPKKGCFTTYINQTLFTD